jgi:hypothetical protein
MGEDSRKERPDTDGRDGKGRFAPGNSGRPPGARNRVTAAAEAVLDDGLGEVAQKCLDLAKEGNTACILALLKMRIPAVRESSAQESIELRQLTSPQDALAALRQIVEAAASGQIDADHARALTSIVDAFLRTFQIVDLDERVRALETANSKGARREAA